MQLLKFIQVKVGGSVSSVVVFVSTFLIVFFLCDVDEARMVRFFEWCGGNREAALQISQDALEEARKLFPGLPVKLTRDEEGCRLSTGNPRMMRTRFADLEIRVPEKNVRLLLSHPEGNFVYRDGTTVFFFEPLGSLEEAVAAADAIRKHWMIKWILGYRDTVHCRSYAYPPFKKTRFCCSLQPLAKATLCGMSPWGGKGDMILLSGPLGGPQHKLEIEDYAASAERLPAFAPGWSIVRFHPQVKAFVSKHPDCRVEFRSCLVPRVLNRRYLLMLTSGESGITVEFEEHERQTKLEVRPFAVRMLSGSLCPSRDESGSPQPQVIPPDN